TRSKFETWGSATRSAESLLLTSHCRRRSRRSFACGGRLLLPGKRAGPFAIWAAGRGVIGRDGAGKPTLLKILSRITQPTTGVSRTRGRVGALLDVGSGFHMELTGRENVFLNGTILGMKR